MSTKLLPKKLQEGNKLQKPKVLPQVNAVGKGESYDDFVNKNGNMDLPLAKRKYAEEAYARKRAEAEASKTKSKLIAKNKNGGKKYTGLK